MSDQTDTKTPRHIIMCKDPTDIVLGMRCIKLLADRPEQYDIIVEFHGKGAWYAKRTKSGFSARSLDE